MYLFHDKINWSGFYFMGKRLVLSGQWGAVSQSTRSILPVIMKFADDKGVAFPSHQTIGILAGVSEKTVSQGIKDIPSLEGVRVEPYKAKSGNKAYRYHVPKYSGDDLIRINQSLFETGYWRELSHTAKSVYIVLRVLAEYDPWTYEIDEDSESFEESYRLRKWDLLRFESLNQIAKLGGISRHSITAAIQSLKNEGLIREHPEEDEQIIMLEPYDPSDEKRTWYKREFLNEKIKKSFKHKQRRL